MFVSVILTTSPMLVPSCCKKKKKKGGGCTIALTPYSPIGEDCSALPGVADVACLHGECAIYRCFQGYRLAPDGHSCDREYSQFDDAEDALVSV